MVGFPINVRAGLRVCDQVNLAKAGGFNDFRFSTHADESPQQVALDRAALGVSPFLVCLDSGIKLDSPAKIDAFRKRSLGYLKEMGVKRAEVLNEPFDQGYTLPQYLALCDSMVPALLAAGLERVYVGSLSTNGDPLSWVKAFASRPWIKDPRVGLSVHQYEPQKPIGTALLHAKSRYGSYVPAERLLVSETGYQDGECPVVWIEDDLATPGNYWNLGRASYSFDGIVLDPKGSPAYFTGKGPSEGYRRITVSLKAESWTTVHLGVWGESDAVEVPVGPSWRSYSVVVKASKQAVNPCVFSILSKTTKVWASGRPSVVALDWTDERYALERLEARKRETRAAQGWADALGLAGVFPYVLSDLPKDSRVFGLLDHDGADKAALSSGNLMAL